MKLNFFFAPFKDINYFWAPLISRLWLRFDFSSQHRHHNQGKETWRYDLYMWSSPNNDLDASMAKLEACLPTASTTHKRQQRGYLQPNRQSRPTRTWFCFAYQLFPLPCYVADSYDPCFYCIFLRSYLRPLKQTCGLYLSIRGVLFFKLPPKEW